MSKCPTCGSDGAYEGLSVVECVTPGCEHYTEPGECECDPTSGCGGKGKSCGCDSQTGKGGSSSTDQFSGPMQMPDEDDWVAPADACDAYSMTTMIRNLEDFVAGPRQGGGVDCD